MSSITGVNSNFGFESLAAAMTKRATDAQGEAALSLLQGTMETVQQVNATAAAAASSNARVGATVDTYA